MCQKVFRRRIVLEGEGGNLVKVAVEILEREKAQINKFASYLCRLCRLERLSIFNLYFF
jgi:hypothetical protein